MHAGIVASAPPSPSPMSEAPSPPPQRGRSKSCRSSALEGLSTFHKSSRPTPLWSASHLANAETKVSQKTMQDVIGEHAQREWARRRRFRAGLKALRSWLGEAHASARQRNYMIESGNRWLLLWDWLLGLASIYSAVFVPLAVVFPETRWDGSWEFEGLLDTCFVLDVLIRLRT